MPNLTVSGNVDTMLGAADNAAIRSAIGVGTTDAPTFLAITLNDTPLVRDAAGILAQRNGTAKQALRIYNTYTSASIYERAVMDWNGPTPGNLQIGTEFLGSGSGMAARPIDFVTGGVVRMSIAAAGNVGVGVIAPRTKLHLEDATVNPLVEFSGATVPAFNGVGFTPNVGTTTTARIGQLSLTNGGLAAYGFTANTNLVPAVLFQAHLGSTSPTVPAIQFVSYKHDGSAARTALASTEINSQWLNGTTVLMTLLGGGNVGIGTTAPASKLQVTAGDIEVDTITKGVILKSPDGTRYRITVPNGGTVLTITAV